MLPGVAEFREAEARGYLVWALEDGAGRKRWKAARDFWKQLPLRKDPWTDSCKYRVHHPSQPFDDTTSIGKRGPTSFHTAQAAGPDVPEKNEGGSPSRGRAESPPWNSSADAIARQGTKQMENSALQNLAAEPAEARNTAWESGFFCRHSGPADTDKL